MQYDAKNIDLRKKYRQYFTYLLAFISINSVIIATLCYQIAPDTNDLYHLANPGDRPNKGESTVQYLFVFSCILTLAAIANWVAPNYMLRRSPQSEPGFAVALMAALVVACIFFAATLVRVQAVRLLVG
ncbi:MULTISPECIES: hypothetical protein [Methylobacterium]|uniref:hypothetical protein n=1 Tax=Methylobacterium TaxID=407 RepID=UPI00272E8907|nr:hypothetical protein [Methylobacterium sp.]